jgi:hypothetical protein
MINWGKVPTKGTNRKQEVYSNPVMIFSAVEKKGGGRKITFNKAAQTALGIVGEDSIQLGFSDDKSHLYLQKTTEGAEGALKLTKTCSFSNKRWFESIVKINTLDITVQNVFNINSVDGTVFEATLRTTDSEEIGVTALGSESATETVEDAIDAPTETISEDTAPVESPTPSEEGTNEGW